jgi:hypothetical protein
VITCTAPTRNSILIITIRVSKRFLISTSFLHSRSAERKIPKIQFPMGNGFIRKKSELGPGIEF